MSFPSEAEKNLVTDTHGFFQIFSYCLQIRGGKSHFVLLRSYFAKDGTPNEKCHRAYRQYLGGPGLRLVEWKMNIVPIKRRCLIEGNYRRKIRIMIYNLYVL